jgi:enoyl-CoA hydratase/carnithine racemase
MLQITRHLRAPASAARAVLPSIAAMSTNAAPTDPEILRRREGPLGVVTLNRPRALNALTTGMVESLHDVLTDFERDPQVAAVAIEGSGARAFCAGGDVKAVVQDAEAGRLQDAFRFFRSEYRTNLKIATLRKPYIAFIDGITMGGGAGVSVHGTFRIATERTLFAMPECAIGLIPDIGASYFLTRLPGGLGLYLGLTGARLAGADVLHAGLATHYVSSELLNELKREIGAIGQAAGDERAVGAVLAWFQGRRAVPAGELLPTHRAAIDAIFSNKDSLEDVYAACEAHGEFGRTTAEAMAK